MLRSYIAPDFCDILTQGIAKLFLFSECMPSLFYRYNKKQLYVQRIPAPFILIVKYFQLVHGYAFYSPKLNYHATKYYLTRTKSCEVVSFQLCTFFVL